MLSLFEGSKKTHHAPAHHAESSPVHVVSSSLANRLSGRVSKASNYADRRQLFSISVQHVLPRPSTDLKEDRSTLEEILKLVDLFQEGGPEVPEGGQVVNLAELHSLWDSDHPREGAVRQNDFAALILAYFLNLKVNTSHHASPVKPTEAIAQVQSALASRRLSSCCGALIYLWLCVSKADLSNDDVFAEIEDTWFAYSNVQAGRVQLLKALSNLRGRRHPSSLSSKSMF